MKPLLVCAFEQHLKDVGLALERVQQQEDFLLEIVEFVTMLDAGAPLTREQIAERNKLMKRACELFPSLGEITEGDVCFS